MATSSKANPPSSSRRLSSASSPAPSPQLARGATARSAASPRVSTLSTANRRPHATKSASPTPVANGEVHESLVVSLKQETDQKEQLLVQLQDKEQLISTYATENNNLSTALSNTESRLSELYAEQSRWEMELAQRIDVSEKLREQVRELEREKRDVLRRYNEQTTTFEAERQAFYDNEQHLKSRIQSLSQSRKRHEPVVIETESDTETDVEQDVSKSQLSDSFSRSRGGQDYNDPDNEPAEMTSLRLELSTLSTSYSSLQSTLILLQTQLVDLKRVNQELQEENESYMILLREKTLSGQYDLMKQVGGASGTDEDDQESTDASSVHSHGRSLLDIVEEEPADVNLDEELSGLIEEEALDSQTTRITSRHERRRTNSSRKGESLADLPITGPGLDLAAELGRAENKDIVASNSSDENRLTTPSKGKRGKKDGSKMRPSESGGLDDIDALRTEVKSLKDANKALSLYASKIIDRIIAQEGFEHVLAADYEKEPPIPVATPFPTNLNPVSSAHSKPRPQSFSMGRSSSNPNTETKLVSPAPPKSDAKTKRRSLSFDWTSFSLFNSNERRPEPSPSLRPLTLTPGAVPVTGARKLDNFEDDEDKKERERLHATMKLMGIQPVQSPTISPVPPSIERVVPKGTTIPPVKSNRRFSFFGNKAANDNNVTDESSVNSAASSFGQNIRSHSGLTEEALEHAEAESSLAALDARERDLSEELARGSGSGFTEIALRKNRRSRKSAGGSSGSTVWSAGMSANDE